MRQQDQDWNRTQTYLNVLKHIGVVADFSQLHDSVHKCLSASFPLRTRGASQIEQIINWSDTSSFFKVGFYRKGKGPSVFSVAYPSHGSKLLLKYSSFWVRCSTFLVTNLWRNYVKLMGLWHDCLFPRILGRQKHRIDAQGMKLLKYHPTFRRNTFSAEMTRAELFRWWERNSFLPAPMQFIVKRLRDFLWHYNS